MSHLIVHAMDTFSAHIHNQNSHKHMHTYIPPIHTHTVSPSSSTISTVATSSTITTLGSDVNKVAKKSSVGSLTVSLISGIETSMTSSPPAGKVKVRSTIPVKSIPSVKRRWYGNVRGHTREGENGGDEREEGDTIGWGRGEGGDERGGCGK